MNIGDAVAALKAGKRVARAGWNGKGMWLALTPGSTWPVERSFPAGAAAQLRLAEPERENITVGAHVDMRAADGTLVIGWLASQTDLLAEDWEVLP